MRSRRGVDESRGEALTRLERLWALGAQGLEPPQTIERAGRTEARRFWRSVARAETAAFVRWWLGGRRPYTQADSATVYRELTDTYPNALRRQVSVVLDRGAVGTAPLATFKRLSLEPIVELMRHERVATALDFGCGWGINTILLRREAPEVRVWSFDASPQRVLSARFNLERLGLPWHRLFVADGSRLPLPDRAVDLVFSTHVLEQMAEVLPAALAEIRRVARRFAVHVEPAWRGARWPHRLRMLRLGYPRDIAERSTALGWRLRERRPMSPAWGKTPGELIVLER